MFQFLFFSFISAKLLPNEDPYKILGVSKLASMDEIKKAYRKLVFSCHPDRHKDEDSYHMFIKVTDAYEILSDQEKKMQFDRNGRIKEKTNQREDTGYTRNEPIPMINQHIFPSLARDGSEWIVLVTQHFDCPECPAQSQIFDEFAKDIKQYVKVGKLDASASPSMVEALGVKTLPAYYSIRYVNGTVQGKKIATTFRSNEQAIEHIFKFWKSSVKKLHGKTQLDNWLELDSTKTHVLEITSNSGVSVHLRYAASQINSYATFASIAETEEIKTHYGIRKSPCVLIFRGHRTQPIQIQTSGRHLLDDIEEYCTPVFPEINRANYKQICNPWCVASTEIPNTTYIDTIYDGPFNTALLRPSFSKSLGIKNGWVAIDGNKFMTIDINSPDDLLSVCSRLYRNDGLKDEGEVIKDDPVSNIVDQILSVFSGIEISNGKLVLTWIQIVIPLPIIFGLVVVIFVFLFICGMYDHTRIEPSSSSKPDNSKSSQKSDQKKPDDKKTQEPKSSEQKEEKNKTDSDKKSEEGKIDQDKSEEDKSDNKKPVQNKNCEDKKDLDEIKPKSE